METPQKCKQQWPWIFFVCIYNTFTGFLRIKMMFCSEFSLWLCNTYSDFFLQKKSHFTEKKNIINEKRVCFSQFYANMQIFVSFLIHRLCWGNEGKTNIRIMLCLIIIIPWLSLHFPLVFYRFSKFHKQKKKTPNQHSV